MGEIGKAIEEFKRKRLGVYKADPDQIVRDTTGAERTTGDYTGRWLFELLQNSEDARASEVKINLEYGNLYVADNGDGFKPEAVDSISGIDFSDKTSGTIGRKGLGFKSVYGISSHPQVLTVGGEGIEFNPERAGEWFRQNGFNDEYIPFQWIPFLIPWDVAAKQDPILAEFKDYKTVVKLSGLSREKIKIVQQMLKEWPPHALFTFRHLRKLNAPNMKVVLTSGDGIWEITDSRKQIPRSWFIVKYGPEYPTKEVMNALGKDERDAIQKDGVGFLIAAPIKDHRIIPVKHYLPIHVFYPIQGSGPVRLLLHAEFLVQSNRTALLPIEKGSFNEWVAKRLALHVCDFVNNAFEAKNPSAHVSLLVPFDKGEPDSVAEKIWRLISDKANTGLQLADVEGRQRLTVGKARLISVSVRPDLARIILESTEFRSRLLHRDFDEDEEAQKALKELGCKAINDQDLIDIIAENAYSRSSDPHWVWSCWNWLADWVGKEPYGDRHKERVTRVGQLPIVPVDGRVCRPVELETHIVTWKPEANVVDLPEWLPLTFIEDWFRDRLQTLTEDEPVKKLCKELNIKEPGKDVIQRAIGLAIEQYWKHKQGDPARFLSFIMQQDWHETSEASSDVQRCPVPLSRPVQGEQWAEAGKAYFGREWGNDLLATLYDGIEDVAWVRKEEGEDKQEKVRSVLEWLGAVAYPRVVVDKKRYTTWYLPTDCNEWKKYLDTARDRDGRRVKKIGDISNIDCLDLLSLNSKQTVLLIRLIAKHWTYYADKAESTAYGAQPRERYYRPWKVKAKWWWEVSERLPLPGRDGGAGQTGLTAHWLLDRKTRRDIGELLPVIDLDVFEEDKDVVFKWLDDVVRLRTRIDQVTVEEWKEILSTRIPEVATVAQLNRNEQLRDKVTRWYEICLDTVAEDENAPQEVFAQCPLLCRKGNEWKYVRNAEPRYLEDDNVFANAFAKDIWLFHVSTSLTANASKYFGVKRLSECVNANASVGEQRTSLSGDLLERFKNALPYVYSWRSSQNRQSADKVSAKLKELQVYVVDYLNLNLSLNGEHPVVVVSRPWHVEKDTIYLQNDHVTEANLALALAKMFDVPSEADFYENLLRCIDENQRKEKLLSKGIVGDEIERGHREYLDRKDRELENEGKKKEPDRENLPPQPLQTENKVQQSKFLVDQQQGKPSEKQQEPAIIGNRQLRLKNSLTVDYMIGESPPKEIGSAGADGGTGGTREGNQLTQEEKNLLEKAGREVAARELRKLGYEVEVTPHENPGFDLRAIREREELRVEVKAHARRATVVEITVPEYKEYLRQQGYRWELWNVEHLSQDDANRVVLTRYDDIPKDAFEASALRVDLKKCHTSKSFMSRHHFVP